jgi:hypothetical protein
MKLRYVAMAALACTVSLVLPSLSSAGTIADWSDQSTMSVGDKTFTFISETNIGQTTVSFSEAIPGFYTIQLSSFANDAGTALTSSWSGELKYDVLVTNPANSFLSASVDTTHVGTGVDVSKTISGSAFSTFTISSIDGSTAGHGISGTLIHVDETFTVGANGGLVNATNAVTQQGPGLNLPEPGSLAVLGLGLATLGGFGWMKRRKAKAAAV